MGSDGEYIEGFNSQAPEALYDAITDARIEATITLDSNGEGVRTIEFQKNATYALSVCPLSSNFDWEAHAQITVTNGPADSDVHLDLIRVANNTF